MLLLTRQSGPRSDPSGWYLVINANKDGKTNWWIVLTQALLCPNLFQHKCIWIVTPFFSWVLASHLAGSMAWENDAKMHIKMPVGMNKNIKRAHWRQTFSVTRNRMLCPEDRVKQSWEGQSLWCAFLRKENKGGRRHLAQCVLAVTQSLALTVLSTVLFPGQAFNKCSQELSFVLQDRQMLFQE